MTVSFTYLSVRIKQLGSHWAISMKFEIWEFFENVSRKFKFDLNLTRITDSLHEDLCTFMVTRWILLTMRTVSDKTCQESQNTLSSNVFQKPCCLWDNLEKHDRPRQATNDNIYDAEKMQFACRIINARIQTHTHNISYLSLSMAIMVTPTRLNIRYVQCLSC